MSATVLAEPGSAESPAGPSLGRGSGAALAVWSALGLAAAFMLSVDKVRLLADPGYEPSCNLNPVLSCGSVMASDQAAVFGFPNPFLGLVGFAIMLTVGVLVASGTRLPAWVVTGAALGAALGAVFVHWLAFQSLYRIGALCPWCLVVWAVTIPTAVWLGLAALLTRAPRSRLLAGLWQWRYSLVALWYLGVVVLSLVRFWDYWSTLL